MSFDLKIKNGDLVLTNGQLEPITESPKLIQDILKICLTAAGSNPLFPGYGSFLSKTIIGNPNYTSMLVQIAKSQLTSCLQGLKELQDLQLKSFQKMSADEQLAGVLDISVSKNQLDPRLFNVYIKVVTKGMKQLNTAFRVDTL